MIISPAAMRAAIRKAAGPLELSWLARNRNTKASRHTVFHR
jgi:hypothetical protein